MPKAARPTPYAHPPLEPRPYPGPPQVREGGSGRGFLYLLMCVIVAASAGAIWNLYGGSAPPHIAAPDAAYKVAPPPELANAPEPPEQNAMYDNLEGADAPNARGAAPNVASAANARPSPETPLASTTATSAPTAAAAPASGRPVVAAAPAFAANGPFVAQIAALQSQDAVAPAWRRLSSRAPQLFRAARLDVERADLGPRGIYYRVRAGYFTDRANADRFCDRIKQMGQDCIVVSRRAG